MWNIQLELLYGAVHFYHWITSWGYFQPFGTLVVVISFMIAGGNVQLIRAKSVDFWIITFMRWIASFSQHNYPLLYKSQRFAAFSEICLLTVLHLPPFILRTYIGMSSKSWGLQFSE